MSSSSPSSSSKSHLATAKTVLSAAASVAAAAVFARSVQGYLPDELQYYISYGLRRFFSYFSSSMTIVIEEFEGYVPNEVYEAAETYLASKISRSTKRIKVSKQKKENNFNVTVDRGEEIVDTFNGVKLQWVLVCCQVDAKNFHNPRDLNSSLKSEVRFFELSFHKKFQNMVLDSYLPFVVKQAISIKQTKRSLKIFALDCYGEAWTPVNLDHPSTFETLAMDPEIKQSILDDLDRFVQRRDFYRRVGRAWKRGYLLYGPPGTGKSSLIAAVANYLNFDIYDLELTAVKSNSELRRLLIATANRSILVVEDIDCTIELKNRTADVPPPKSEEKDPLRRKMTLSGVLNCIDGLWSSCGDERIIIFTTNCKGKLDPALLRPGRMDRHIHMSYCTPSSFRVLAANYLQTKEHKLFGEIDEAITAMEVTPAEVAEQLMRNSDCVDKVLEELVQFLGVKKSENEEANANNKLERESEMEKEKKGNEVESLVLKEM